MVTWSRAAILMLLLLTLVEAQEPIKCRVCGRLDEVKYRVGGHPYCEEHWQNGLPSCSTCGKLVTAGTVSAGADGGYNCRDCLKAHSQCYLCASPCVPEKGGRKLPDGRSICGPDYQTAIFEAKKARAIFDQSVRETIATLGRQMALKDPVTEITLVDAQAMAEITNSMPKSEILKGRLLGLTRSHSEKIGTDAWEAPYVTIWLLSGIPRDRLRLVCAHEYTHAWLAHNHPNINAASSEMKEGFCEWVAYKVGQRARLDAQLAVMLRPGLSPYSTGLKKFLELEKRVGVAGVLRHAVTATDI